jgi:hypothetical protein
MLSKGIPSSAIDITIASLSNNTIKQYSVCYKKWFIYCKSNNIDLYKPSITSVLNFLTNVFHSGNQYSTINSYRSALALILDNIMKEEVISRFCKGVYRLRPSMPRYNITWDTSVVLQYLGGLYPHEQISLEQITKKCATLIALVTAHRVQTLSKIHIKNIILTEHQILIKITDIIKTSRPGTNQPLLHLPFFQEKPQICPAKALLSYIQKTEVLRQDDKLFISTRKPFNSVTCQTISRWIKCTLKDSGIDVSIFTGHSTRHASTSLACKKGISIDLIRNTAGWSGNSATFARFYNRVIVNANGSEFARAIL